MASAPEDNLPQCNQESTDHRDGADAPHDGFACAPRDRVEQLAEILAPRHERMLAAAVLAEDEIAAGMLDDPCELDDLLIAEIDGLDACLRRVERARRESIVYSAQFSAPGDADDDEMFGFLDGTADGVPRRLGRFTIIRELGRGGLGVVLLAYDPVLKRQVALKIPRPEALLTAELRERFQHEAQAAARLAHPHIVPVHEVGDVGPICFIAAAYVEGLSLSEWLRSLAGAMQPRAAAELVTDLADAMHYAHGQGVLHRDLKPGNILLEPGLARDALPDAAGIDSGAAPRWIPKIADFGLAKIMDSARDETRTGVILGTPAYMSPEQAMGGKCKIGPESDVYSLGAILYELLTGKPPFRGDSDTETLMHVSNSLPVAPRRVKASIPTDLEAICLHCLEKSPAQRYRTAAALATDLRHFLAGEPTIVRPLSAAKRLIRWGRRRPEYAALAALGLVSFLTIAAGVLIHTRELNEAVDLANRNAVLAEGNRQVAEKHEDRANEQLYVAQMRLADRALRDGDLPTVRKLLDSYEPGQDLNRLRGVEWHVLHAEAERAANAGKNSSTTVYDHPANVDAVQFTRDGRWLLSGCEDGHLRIWLAAEGRLLWDIPAHGSCINQVRVSPDGRWLLTASCDTTVGIWQIHPSGPPAAVHRLPHETPVRQLAFSPDGQQFATLCDGRQIAPDVVRGAIYIWQVESGERVHFDEFPALMGAHGLDWSRDGRYLATLRDDVVTVFRTTDWKEHYQKRFPFDSKRMSGPRIAFEPHGGPLTVCVQNSLQQIDLDTGVESTRLETLNSGEFSWSADGCFVAISGRDGMVHLFDGWNAFRPHSFDQHHTGRIVEMAFSPDGSRLATAGFDRRVCVTDLSTRLGKVPVVRRALCLQPDTVRRYDASNRRMTWLQKGEFRRLEMNRPPNSAQADEILAPDQQFAEHGEGSLHFLLPSDASLHNGMSTSGKRAAWTRGCQVTVADLEARTQTDLPPELTTNVVQVLVFDQRPIALLINHYSVDVFDVSMRRPIISEQFELGPMHDMTAELSPDGRFLLILNAPESVRLIDLATARCQVVSKENWWNSIAPTFSPDSRYFSMIVNETFVGVWDTKSLEMKHCLQPRQRPLRTAFSPDSRTLAIASERQLAFWNIAQGQEMVSLPIAATPVCIQFSSDRSRLSCVTEGKEEVEIYEWSFADE